MSELPSLLAAEWHALALLVNGKRIGKKRARRIIAEAFGVDWRKVHLLEGKCGTVRAYAIGQTGSLPESA